MKVDISDYPKGAGDRSVNVDISVHDIFSLYHTLALIILPALKKFRETGHGYPISLTSVEWDDILDKMIYSFEVVVEDDFASSNTKVQEGLKLFGEWYQDLWY